MRSIAGIGVLALCAVSSATTVADYGNGTGYITVGIDPAYSDPSASLSCTYSSVYIGTLNPMGITSNYSYAYTDARSYGTSSGGSWAYPASSGTSYTSNSEETETYFSLINSDQSRTINVGLKFTEIGTAGAAGDPHGQAAGYSSTTFYNYATGEFLWVNLSAVSGDLNKTTEGNFYGYNLSSLGGSGGSGNTTYLPVDAPGSVSSSWTADDFVTVAPHSSIAFYIKEDTSHWARHDPVPEPATLIPLLFGFVPVLRKRPRGQQK